MAAAPQSPAPAPAPALMPAHPPTPVQTPIVITPRRNTCGVFTTEVSPCSFKDRVVVLALEEGTVLGDHDQWFFEIWARECSSVRIDCTCLRLLPLSERFVRSLGSLLSPTSTVQACPWTESALARLCPAVRTEPLNDMRHVCLKLCSDPSKIGTGQCLHVAASGELLGPVVRVDIVRPGDSDLAHIATAFAAGTSRATVLTRLQSFADNSMGDQERVCNDAVELRDAVRASSPRTTVHIVQPWMHCLTVLPGLPVDGILLSAWCRNVRRLREALQWARDVPWVSEDAAVIMHVACVLDVQTVVAKVTDNYIRLDVECGPGQQSVLQWLLERTDAELQRVVSVDVGLWNYAALRWWRSASAAVQARGFCFRCTGYMHDTEADVSKIVVLCPTDRAESTRLCKKALNDMHIFPPDDVLLAEQTVGVSWDELLRWYLGGRDVDIRTNDLHAWEQFQACAAASPEMRAAIRRLRPFDDDAAFEALGLWFERDRPAPSVPVHDVFAAMEACPGMDSKWAAKLLQAATPGSGKVRHWAPYVTASEAGLATATHVAQCVAAGTSKHCTIDADTIAQVDPVLLHSVSFTDACMLLRAAVCREATPAVPFGRPIPSRRLPADPMTLVSNMSESRRCKRKARPE